GAGMGGAGAVRCVGAAIDGAGVGLWLGAGAAFVVQSAPLSSASVRQSGSVAIKLSLILIIVLVCCGLASAEADVALQSSRQRASPSSNSLRTVSLGTQPLVPLACRRC